MEIRGVSNYQYWTPVCMKRLQNTQEAPYFCSYYTFVEKAYNWTRRVKVVQKDFILEIIGRPDEEVNDSGLV